MILSSGGRRRTALAGAAAALASLALAARAQADQPSTSDGSFVIGDQNVYVGAPVTFWGAQWWKANPLSTGLAPASFKGYADGVSPTCGAWTTDPGNSSHPPATLSGYVPMIVTSQVTKNGSVISGNTTEVVLVQVDPGYAGDPGHPGTGTVARLTVCGGDDGGGVINT
jgi:hypothetical protein